MHCNARLSQSTASRAGGAALALEAQASEIRLISDPEDVRALLGGTPRRAAPACGYVFFNVCRWCYVGQQCGGGGNRTGGYTGDNVGGGADLQCFGGCKRQFWTDAVQCGSGCRRRAGAPSKRRQQGRAPAALLQDCSVAASLVRSERARVRAHERARADAARGGSAVAQPSAPLREQGGALRHARPEQPFLGGKELLRAEHCAVEGKQKGRARRRGPRAGVLWHRCVLSVRL